jgi:hypothetical protein
MLPDGVFSSAPDLLRGNKFPFLKMLRTKSAHADILETSAKCRRHERYLLAGILISANKVKDYNPCQQREGFIVRRRELHPTAIRKIDTRN